jgi:hypothetical protein
MNTAKHTPGPWEWDGDYTLRPANPRPELHTVHTILSPDGETFGFMEADYKDVLAENAANKLLMAASPDMLEVLKTTLDNIMSLGPAGALESVPMPFRVWADVVKAVIDKAEGRA